MTIGDLPWGFWNGLTAWIVLLVHVFGGWGDFPVFDVARNGNWYAFGFLVGAGSPLLGAGARSGSTRRTEPGADTGGWHRGRHAVPTP